MFNDLFLCYVHWCYVCLYVCMMVPDALELKLQTVVNCYVGVGIWIQVL